MNKSGGGIIASIPTTYYDEIDYRLVNDDLVAFRKAKLVKQIKDVPYTNDENVHYWIYQVATT